MAGCDVTREPEAVRATIGVTGQFSAVDELMTAEENLCGRRFPAGRGQARCRQQKATSATRRRLTGHTGRWIMRRRPRR